MSGWLVPISVPLDVPIDLDRLEAQRRAVEELAKAKYGGVPPFVSDAFRRLLDVLERLSTFLSGLGEVRGGGLSPGFLLGTVVLLAAIGWVVWRVGVPRWSRRARRPVELELDSARPAADYRASAEAAASAGDWSLAVRDRFRALVRELEIRTVIDARPARTAWEAAFAARRVLPERGDQLLTGADLFSAVSYGDRPASEADYRAMGTIDDEVTAAADSADLADQSLEPTSGRVW